MKFGLIGIRIRKAGFLTEPANSHNLNTFIFNWTEKEHSCAQTPQRNFSRPTQPTSQYKTKLLELALALQIKTVINQLNLPP